MTKRLLGTQRIVNLSSDPGTGSAGEIYFNTSSNTLKFHNGTSWTAFGGGSGGGVTISTTAPVSPTAGDLWYNSTDSNMYVYYDSFWIEVGASPLTNQTITTDVALSNSWWLGV